MKDSDIDRLFSGHKIPEFRNPEHKNVLKPQLLSKQQNPNSAWHKPEPGFFVQWWNTTISVPQPIALGIVFVLVVSLLMHLPIKTKDTGQPDSNLPGKIQSDTPGKKLKPYVENFQVTFYRPGEGVVYEKYIKGISEQNENME